MSAHEAKPVAAHREEINMKAIVVIGAACLVVFALCVVAAWIELRHYTRQIEAEGAAPPLTLEAVRHAEVGIVDQVVFTEDRRLDDWQAERRAHLESYGWVDRGRGVIRVPIDRAMDEVVNQAAAPAPALAPVMAPPAPAPVRKAVPRAPAEAPADKAVAP